MKSDHENFLMTLLFENDTACKVSKHGVFSGPYFPVFSPCTGKNGPEGQIYSNNILSVL